VSQYQKDKTNLDFTEARESEWQWHQLEHMHVSTSLQTDNHANTPPLSFLQAGCPSCHLTNSVKALKAKDKAVSRKLTARKLSGVCYRYVVARVSLTWSLEMTDAQSGTSSAGPSLRTAAADVAASASASVGGDNVLLVGTASSKNVMSSSIGVRSAF